MDTSPKKELLRFLSEDIRSGDITSALLAKKKIEAKIISRQQGVIAGVKFAKNLFQLKLYVIVLKNEAIVVFGVWFVVQNHRILMTIVVNIIRG